MKKVLLVEDPPTIPRLTNDLDGFRLYAKAAGHFTTQQHLKNFDQIIQQQEERNYAPEKPPSQP